MNQKLGICTIGLNGAVATTVVAGVALMKKGLVPRQGMITETEFARGLDLASLDNLVFGGWDLRSDNGFEAAVSHEVVQRHLLEQVRGELSALRPWPAVVSERFLFSMSGKNFVIAKTARDELFQIEQSILKFKGEHKLDRLVIVNLTSTERFTQVEDVHQTIEAFEAGLDSNDERISPAMKYFYVACKMGIPHFNFTPSLTKIPALEQLAEKCGVPIAGEDGKTGQTLLKTVLAPALVARQLKVEGWYSTNILGNNDGLVLNDPASNKTKIESKKSVLDSILGYQTDHQVHIHYYKPRGDAKEAWDNIDVSGFLGERMQIKVNFLCKDSILAAPIILDVTRLLDLAKRKGESGIQRQFSMFFKAPYHTVGEQQVHDFFKQRDLLAQWAESIASPRGDSAAKSRKHTPQPEARALL